MADTKGRERCLATYPAHNALTYLAYQCDYTKPGRVSSISRVGRFYTVTKEFIDSLGL